MVWGVENPNQFGKYFPNAGPVGWRERLKDYYDNEMSEAEKAEMGMKEGLLLSKIADKFTRDKGPLKPHECPTEFQALEMYKTLGSLIKLESRLLAVDEALKGIIEALEPGVHQFWPIRIVMPKGKEYPTQFFGMVIRRFLDSFSPEQSEEGSWRRSEYGSYFVSMSRKHAHGGLALSQAVFGSAHLWRERRLRRPDVFLSDPLQAEIARSGLSIPKHYKLKAV